MPITTLDPLGFSLKQTRIRISEVGQLRLLRPGMMAQADDRLPLHCCGLRNARGNAPLPRGIG